MIAYFLDCIVKIFHVFTEQVFTNSEFVSQFFFFWHAINQTIYLFHRRFQNKKETEFSSFRNALHSAVLMQLALQLYSTTRSAQRETTEKSLAGIKQLCKGLFLGSEGEISHVNSSSDKADRQEQRCNPSFLASCTQL